MPGRDRTGKFPSTKYEFCYGVAATFSARGSRGDDANDAHGGACWRVAVWNTAFVALRDRRSRSLGAEEVMAPEVFVPTFGQVVGMSGGLAMLALILTIGVKFDDQLTSELLDEK